MSPFIFHFYYFGECNRFYLKVGFSFVILLILYSFIVPALNRNQYGFARISFGCRFTMYTHRHTCILVPEQHQRKSGASKVAFFFSPIQFHILLKLKMKMNCIQFINTRAIIQKKTRSKRHKCVHSNRYFLILIAPDFRQVCIEVV